MQVIIEFSEAEERKALPILLRRTNGRILPGRRYVIDDTAGLNAGSEGGRYPGGATGETRGWKISLPGRSLNPRFTRALRKPIEIRTFGGYTQVRDPNMRPS